MARYFWCAFSTYSRYASNDLRDRLLDSISSSHSKNWHKETVYRHIWHEAFNDLLNDYCLALENITNRYLQSLAGKSLSAVCAKQRKNNKPLPFVDVDCLRKFDNKPGISWGIGVVEEFFLPLKEIAETSPLEHRVHIFVGLQLI